MSPTRKSAWVSLRTTSTSSAFSAGVMRATSVRARAGTIACRASAGGSSSGACRTARRYESVATIVRPSGASRSCTPVSTGRVSSRDAARATRSIASTSSSDGTVRPVPSSAGSSGKSPAWRQLSEKDEPPPTR